MRPPHEGGRIEEGGRAQARMNVAVNRLEQSLYSYAPTRTPQ